MKIKKKIILYFIKVLKNNNVKISKNTDFWKTKFLGNNRIGRNCIISYSEIGNMTYIGNNCNLSRVRIGNFCSIGSNVEIVYGKHPTSLFFSTHPSFYSTAKQSGITFTSEDLYEENKRLEGKYSAKIEHDVWIGNNVVIMEGINIGTGSIIATGSVVVKDVTPYTIVGGVPAKVIKYRFSDRVVESLLKSRWWAHDSNWFFDKNNIKMLNDILKGVENEEGR